MELLPPPRAAANNSIVGASIVDAGHVYREGVGVLVHRSEGNVISDSEIGWLGYTAV